MTLQVAEGKPVTPQAAHCGNLSLSSGKQLRVMSRLTHKRAEEAKYSIHFWLISFLSARKCKIICIESENKLNIMSTYPDIQKSCEKVFQGSFPVKPQMSIADVCVNIFH